MMLVMPYGVWLSVKQPFGNQTKEYKAMHSRWKRLARLIRYCFILSVLYSIYGAACVQAHNGIDHGGDSAEAAIHDASEPRFSVRSERTEVVGIVLGNNIELFVDHAEDNSPVAGARVEIEANGLNLGAVSIGPGHYRLSSQWLRPGEANSMLVSILAEDVQDLLAAEIYMPARPELAPGVIDAEKVMQYTPAMGVMLLSVYILWLIRSGLPARRGFHLSYDLAMLGVAVVIITLVLQDDMGTVKAQGSGSEEPVADLVKTIRRLPDGSLFVPKPAQHMLGIRTAATRKASTHASERVPGKIIVDPSASARVLAQQAGVIMPPPDGFPRLGQSVKKNDILAYLQPIVSGAERASLEAELALVNRDILLTRQQVKRIELQSSHANQDNSVLLEVRQTELNGLMQKKAALERIFHASEAIRAPIAGLVGDIEISAGLAVNRGTKLFDLLDADRLLVEALIYDDKLQMPVAAHAELSNGLRLGLKLVGRGPQLRGLGQPLQFEVDTQAGNLTPGQMVTVVLGYGPAYEAIVLPEDSMVRGERGERLVWVHREPERFVPLVVDARNDFDGHVFVNDVSLAGMNVVTSGADLIGALP